MSEDTRLYAIINRALYRLTPSLEELYGEFTAGLLPKPPGERKGARRHKGDRVPTIMALPDEEVNLGKRIPFADKKLVILNKRADQLPPRHTTGEW